MNNNTLDGNNTSVLFSPIKIRGVNFPNRIAMGPMTVTQATADGQVTDFLVEWYRRRAAAQVGIIILSATYVQPIGCGWKNLMGVDSDTHIQGIRRIADAVHAEGAVLGLQLFHGGAKAPASVIGEQPVSASNVQIGDGDEPRMLSIPEIDQTVTAFAEGAKRAKTAGCDFIEIHGAHGYLIDQFIQQETNSRTDKFGGSIQNRTRFAVEITSAIRTIVGPEFPVFYRFSTVTPNSNKTYPSLPDLKYLVEEIDRAGADVFDVSCIRSTVFNTSHGTNKTLLEHTRELTRLPLVGAGGIREPKDAANLVRSKHCDIIALASSLISDSKWAEKIKNDELDKIDHPTQKHLQQLSNGEDPGIS